MPKKLESGPAAASGATAGASKGSMEKKLPTLAGWLFDQAYEDGELMGRTKLEISRDGQDVLLVLKIEDAGGRKVSVRERDPDRAHAALEALLASEHCPWQVDPYPLGGGARKKPRR